ncbi:MAG: galactose ABC transporter substrate-binding protein [Oscillospiraceae bacterium]
MKKILVLMLASMLTLSLAACSTTPTVSSSDTTTPSSETSAPNEETKTVKVGVCIYKFDDNFMTVYRNELDNYLKSLSTDEVKYEVTIVDGKGDQAEQTNQVNTFIADGVDVLIMNLVQSSSASTVIELAKKADVPVVFINREPTTEDLAIWDKVTYVGADARQSGTFQGEIINELPNKGDLDSDGTINYVMLVGDPENVDAQYRTDFSIKAVTDSGMKVNKLVEQRGDWAQEKGQEIVASALAQHGKKIEVVFSNNDGMALGAIQAITAAGRKVGEDIYIVGVDALPEAVELVESGGMTGTVLNDAIGQSHTAVDVALKLVAGETMDKTYTVDYVKVVK